LPDKLESKGAINKFVTLDLMKISRIMLTFCW